MQFAEFKERFFPDAKRAGKGFVARCPSHQDKSPSMSLSPGVKGIVVKCFAGCSTEAICQNLGIQKHELFYDSTGAIPFHHLPSKPGRNIFKDLNSAISNYEKMLGELSARYDYLDGAGEVSLVILRWDRENKKEIRPVSRADNGWVLSFPEGKRHLYRLPEIAQAAKEGRTIFICEGEKTTDAAIGVGLDATTSPGGSQSPSKTDWMPIAFAKDVVILPDHDKAGKKYATEVAEILLGLNPKIRIRVCDLPGLEEGQDLFEWVASYGDAAESETLQAEISRLVDDCFNWEPLTVALPKTLKDETHDFEALPFEPNIETSIPAKLVFRSVPELIQQFPRMREPIIDGLLRRGETMNLIAPPKVGKSWLVIDLAISVALGRNWLDFPTRAGKVLIIDNELHEETTADRIQKVANARGLGGNDLGDKILVANSRGQLIDISGLGIQLANFAPNQISLIILDAFYRFMPAGTDENDNGGMTTIYNLIDSYAESNGCSFVLIHHASKGSQAGKGITDVGSGAGSMSRAADSHLILRAHNQEEVVVMDAVTRSFKPIQSRCLRKNHPLWEVDSLADPADLKSEYSRKRTKPVEEESKQPEKETWDAGKFKIKFATEQPIIGLKIVEDAVAAGLSKARAKELLKIAEAEKLIFRHTIGLNSSPYYATEPQRFETKEPVKDENPLPKKPRARRKDGSD